MQCTVITPEKQLFNGAVRSVRVPGTKGQFQILKGHAPIVSSLETGAVEVVEPSGTKHSFEIVRGFVEVLRDEVSVICVTEETVEAMTAE
jgi:F-type H+-transporting ATPase subunit epsilon